VARILENLGPTPVSVAQPALILMAGLPGSGKSTFARRLAAATGATVLESDALRSQLFTAPTHDATESRALFAALFDVAGRLLRVGHTVIIDATNLKRSDRRPAHELAAATGARLMIVHTSAPEPVVLERLRRRSAGFDRNDHSKAGEAVYRHMAEEAQPITQDHWQIDTSDERGSESALLRLVEELRLSGASRPERSLVTGGSIS
jgi:predicted kinase